VHSCTSGGQVSSLLTNVAERKCCVGSEFFNSPNGRALSQLQRLTPASRNDFLHRTGVLAVYGLPAIYELRISGWQISVKQPARGDVRKIGEKRGRLLQVLLRPLSGSGCSECDLSTFATRITEHCIFQFCKFSDVAASRYAGAALYAGTALITPRAPRRFGRLRVRCQARWRISSVFAGRHTRLTRVSQSTRFNCCSGPIRGQNSWKSPFFTAAAKLLADFSD
jgi:hypothetical protein